MVGFYYFSNVFYLCNYTVLRLHFFLPNPDFKMHNHKTMFIKIVMIYDNQKGKLPQTISAFNVWKLFICPTVMAQFYPFKFLFKRWNMVKY